MSGTKRTASDSLEEEGRKRTRIDNRRSIPPLPNTDISLVRLARWTQWALREGRTETEPMALAYNVFLRSQAQMTDHVIEHSSRYPEIPPLTVHEMGGIIRTLSEKEYFVSKTVLCGISPLVELCVEAIRHRARVDELVHQKAETMIPEDLWNRWFRPCAYTQDPWLSVKWMKLSGCCSSCYYRRTDPEHAEEMSALVKKLEMGY